MAEGIPDDVEAQFARIRQQFVSGLARRLQDIERAPDAEALHAVLHRLAGAAGSFGYEALSLLTRQTMAAVDAGDPAARAQYLALLKAAIQNLLASGGQGDTIS